MAEKTTTTTTTVDEDTTTTTTTVDETTTTTTTTVEGNEQKLNKNSAEYREREEQVNGVEHLEDAKSQALQNAQSEGLNPANYRKEDTKFLGDTDQG